MKRKKIKKNVLLMVFAVSSMCLSLARTAAQIPPQGRIAYNDYGTDDLVALVGSLQACHRHAEAIEAGEKALNRNLTSEQSAFVHHRMAKSYEFVPDGGPLAKQKYEEVLKLHPDYPRSIEAAYRLGELNSSVIMAGTEPNRTRAIQCWEYVLRKCEDPTANENKVYYIALKAHMGLGILYWNKKDYSTAKGHFEAIYKCQINQAEPLPYEKFNDPNDLKERKDWLRNRISGMKKRIPSKLVGLCIRPDSVESMVELQKLATEYPADPNIAEPAKKAVRQVMEIEKIEQEVLDSLENIEVPGDED